MNHPGSTFAVDLQRTHPPGACHPFRTFRPRFKRRHSSMAKRHQFAFVLATIFASMGASYRTTNFMVEAQTPQIAAQVGQWAEHYRKEKAIQWLGREMPPWPEPCPLRATVTQNGAGGATTFNFMGANIWQTMHI